METTGILPAVGVLTDNLVSHHSQDQLEQGWVPKAHTAWALHQASREMELHWFVLFSSVYNVLGRAESALYAASNACLDRLARMRQEVGLVGVSLLWGSWTERRAIPSIGTVEQQTRMVNMNQGLSALQLSTNGTPVLRIIPPDTSSLLPNVSHMHKQAVGYMAAKTPAFLESTSKST